MATITSSELTSLRQETSKDPSMSLNYLKSEINAALQALEDWYDDPATKTEVSNRINTATSPHVFTNNQKKKIAKYWLRNKFGRE